MNFFFLKISLSYYVLCIISPSIAWNDAHKTKPNEVCITFDQTEGSQNTCYRRTFNVTNFISTELNCLLFSMNPLTVRQCYRPTSRINFFFYDNSLFERYFNAHQNNIERLFHQNGTENVVAVIFDRVNLTEISWNYIQRSFHSVLKFTHKFSLRFHIINNTDNKLRFANDFSQAPAGLLVTLPCPNSNELTRTHVVINGSMVSLNDSECTSSSWIDLKRKRIEFRMLQVCFNRLPQQNLQRPPRKP